MQIKNSVALITGASKRIGKAMALQLAKRGCHLIVHYGRSADEAEETVQELLLHGVNACSVQAELSDLEQVKSLIPTALQTLAGTPTAGSNGSLDTTGIDILINNASVFPEETFDEVTPDSWDHTHSINLKTPFLLSQAFARQLPVGKQGKIINLLDSTSPRPRASHFSYTMSKYALVGLTEACARSLAIQNIQVNGIALGAMLPSINGEAAEIFARRATANLSGRNGTPQDVCATLLYFVEHADYVTGEVISLDGGQHLV